METENAVTLLDKAAILGAVDIVTEDVFVPAWNGTVRVRALSAEAWDDYQASIVEMKQKADGQMAATVNRTHMRAKLVSKALVDAQGALMFSTPADIATLSRKSAKALDFLFDAVQRISGVKDEEVAAEAGKSEAAPATTLAIA